jgi:hypothetical protein
MAVAHEAEYAAESSRTDTSAPFVKLGASFTALTAMETVAGADVVSPSVAVNVKLSPPK